MTSSRMARAKRRRLQIYASDPMSGRRSRYRAVIDIENEPNLMPGPAGDLIEVVDYDGVHDQYYEAVDLNDSALLMEDGVPPNDSDPRFHQQMVYAVTMKVVESARRALGRPIQFYKSSRNAKLKLIPHAFYGENAFFDEKRNAILFGYFRASRENPGPNLPGQMVFTCLSHDIIAHEVTHAIVDRLRPNFLEPTNLDVLAFHEAFSDIVALFQRFSYREILTEHIERSGGELQNESMMVDLAAQFGYATGAGVALRSALGVEPDPSALDRVLEPHRRGAVLVSAVFDGFFRTYERRIEDLLRIAAGGMALRPAGPLHPDLVSRVADEVAYLADHVLRMCIRAFDYLPPVDVTFGDFLRALVTADYELNPEDPYELRYHMIEGFRARGIYPDDVTSLAEESLVWQGADDLDLPRLPPKVIPHLHTLLVITASALEETERASERQQEPTKTARREKTYLQSYQQMVHETEEDDGDGEGVDRERKIKKALAAALTVYAKQNAAQLGLKPARTRPIAVSGFHPVHRIGADQRLVVELVVQFVQTDESRREEMGGIPLRAGATVIFDAEGYVRYVIAKPVGFDGLSDRYKDAAEARATRTRQFYTEADLADPRMAWREKDYYAKRMKLRMNLRALHGGVV